MAINNLHLISRQHGKRAKFYAIKTTPINKGDMDYYEEWPPSAINASSNFPERVHRTIVNPCLNLMRTMDESKCAHCLGNISFNVNCWEVKPCNHRLHPECYQEITRRRGILPQGQICCTG